MFLSSLAAVRRHCRHVSGNSNKQDAGEQVPAHRCLPVSLIYHLYIYAKSGEVASKHEARWASANDTNLTLGCRRLRQLKAGE